MFAYFNGLILGLSLIITLGPQNIFLIKQGARRNHAALSAVVCFICDIILMSASVVGLHQLLSNHPVLQTWMMWLGSVFLFYYAIKNLYHAFSKSNPKIGSSHPLYNRIQIIFFALGFSLLNPHSIIDTLVIIGSNSSQFPDQEMIFLLGVLTSSLLWFSSIFFTTRYFSNVLTKVKIWQGIELFSGLLMAFIGIKLVLSTV